MKSVSPRPKILHAGIVISWVVIMSVLFFKHYDSGNKTENSLSKGVMPPVLFEEQWMGVYHDTLKIGHARRKIEKNDAGFLLREYLTMQLTLMDAGKLVETETEIYLDRQMDEEGRGRLFHS